MGFEDIRRKSRKQLPQMSDEKIIVSHKIRLRKLSNKQKSSLHQGFGAARFCYNQAKAVSDMYYQENKKTLGKLNLRNHLVQNTKKDNPWLYVLPKSILEEAVFDYDTSRKSFFKRGHGFPKFRKRRDGYGSFSMNNSQFKIEGRVLTLIKLGKFRLTESLRFEGKLLSITVSQKGSNYYASFTMETNKSPMPQTGAEVGLDFNIHSIATSDGILLPHVQYLKLDQKILAKAQRSMSRKVKGSNNWKKSLDRVRKIYERISNKRLDAHHKLSYQVVRNNSVIFLEDLNVRGMVKNRKLAKAISDASFFQLSNQIRYKCENNDRVLVKVGRFYPSSKTCSNCGLVKAKLDLSERIFECEGCGHTINRDLNAAINIREEGNRLLTQTDPGLLGSKACGDSVRHGLDFLVEPVLESVKQEPTSVLE